MPGEAGEVEISGRRLKLSSLEKVYYPSTGMRKGEVIDYYVQAAPYLLPHLKGRPLTLKRHPEGATGPGFYQKECPPHPDWFTTAPMWSDTRERSIDFCVADDLASLCWLVNLGDLELHTFLARRDDLERPTSVVLDLDPGPGAGIPDCCAVALWLREELDAMGLRAFPKTSGKKGLQMHIPLNTPATYAQTKPFAHQLAATIEGRHNDRVVSSMRKDLRRDKVLIDWSQNDHHKTTVCVYSLRATTRPTVSTPLRWEEVEAGATEAEPLAFEWQDALARAHRMGDLYAEVQTLEQGLPVGPGPAARRAEQRKSKP